MTDPRDPFRNYDRWLEAPYADAPDNEEEDDDDGEGRADEAFDRQRDEWAEAPERGPDDPF